MIIDARMPRMELTGIKCLFHVSSPTMVPGSATASGGLVRVQREHGIANDRVETVEWHAGICGEAFGVCSAHACDGGGLHPLVTGLRLNLALSLGSQTMTVTASSRLCCELRVWSCVFFFFCHLFLCEQLPAPVLI